MEALLEISMWEWGVMGVLVLCFIFQMYWYARYMCAPMRKMRYDKRAATDSSSEQTPDSPGVSVIICAHNECENLSNYLQALLSQQYPAFEVIVVDDGSEDSTRDVVERYMIHDTRVRMTFVPYGARVQSTKKLAITLAAKSAVYDYLLLTDADCVPASPYWIQEMMSGFRKEQRDKEQGTTDIVLGFSPYFETEGHINRLVRFDTLFNGLHYLGSALCGHPYMGVGRNLAYRKSLFFESGGFSHMMNNRSGDDDLFVNHVATKQNTSVVFTKNSLVWSLPKRSLKDWWQQKRRHVSVSPAYRGITKFRLTLEPITRGLFYTAFVAVCALRYETLMALGNDWLAVNSIILSAVGLFLIRWIVQTAVLNGAARRLGLKRFSMFTVLWFDIVLPLVNLWMIVVPRKYTWK